METSNDIGQPRTVLSYAAPGTGAAWPMIALAPLVVTLVIAPDLIAMYLVDPSRLAKEIRDSPLLVSVLAIGWAVRSLVVIAGLWAHRRFRLVTVPWLLAWVLIDNASIGFAVRTIVAKSMS